MDTTFIFEDNYVYMIPSCGITLLCMMDSYVKLKWGLKTNWFYQQASNMQSGPLPKDCNMFDCFDRMWLLFWSILISSVCGLLNWDILLCMKQIFLVCATCDCLDRDLIELKFNSCCAVWPIGSRAWDIKVWSLWRICVQPKSNCIQWVKLWFNTGFDTQFNTEVKLPSIVH